MFSAPSLVRNNLSCDDADGRLVRVWDYNYPSYTPRQSYQYAYDYRGRRVVREGDAKTSGTGIANTWVGAVYSGGTGVREYGAHTTASFSNPEWWAPSWTVANTTVAASVEYVRGSDWGGGVGGVLYSLHGDVPNFYHYDGRGDVVAETSGATGALAYQAAYNAFGEHTPGGVAMPEGSGNVVPPAPDAQEITASGAITDDLRANSKEEDPTGLLFEGQRYRILGTDTFMTADPAGMVNGPNPYTYVEQNPWTKFDPEGLATGNPYPDRGPQVPIQRIPIQVVPGSVWAGSAEGLTDLAYSVYKLATMGPTAQLIIQHTSAGKTFDQGMADAHNEMNAQIEHGVTQATGQPIEPGMKNAANAATQMLVGGELAKGLIGDAPVSPKPATSAPPSTPGTVPTTAEPPSATGTSTPVAGGGAKVENLTPSQIARIQGVADNRGLNITVIGSRAAGTADPYSDWDYIIEGGNSKARRSALYELPKNPNATKGGDFRPGSEMLNVDVDPKKPNIAFKPAPASGT